MALVSNTTDRKSRVTFDRVNEEHRYNFFSAVAGYATALEWKTIFENAAKGIYPPGIHCVNGVLTHSNNGRFHRLTIPDNPEEAYKKCVAFFRARGVCAKRDTESVRAQLGGWAVVKRDEHKHFFLHRYVLHLTELYGLEQAEVEQLWQILALATLSRSLPNQSVEFDHGTIKNIKCLYWDPEQRFFSLC